MSLEGARLGIYRVDREIGRGGMGTVYRAHSEAEGPAGPAGAGVALKVFHAHLHEEEQAFERFQREAEIGRRIRHPNVVRTYDLGRQEVDGAAVDYLVMDVIEGQTLESLVRELGVVPEALRLQIAVQALDGLGAIHAEGVVHRDVKPENLVITPDHRVLIMDLGVARLSSHGATLTQAGQFVGSLAYAAPEQFGSDEASVDARADLYAFGVVLYELATGRCPFDPADLGALLRAKLTDALPSPRTVRSDVDAFWSEAIGTATRAKPEERFASAAEMRRVLEEGEAGAWWLDRAARLGELAVGRALKRLQLEREAPLVGREEPLARLEAVWEEARARGGVCVVGGPSGVGKSRLVLEFVERLLARGGATVAAGRCVGVGGRVLQPFVEAILDLLLPPSLPPGERRTALTSRLEGLLAETPGVVPHVADFLLGGVAPGAEGASSKDALLGACARVLERLSRERPLVVVVEDLHWAGPETVELFRWIGRAVSGHPLLLLGVGSDDQLEEDAPAQGLVGAATFRESERLTVGPLDDAATEDLVRAVVRTERTVRALARPLHERCDGNALLVLETLAHFKEEGVLAARDGGFELTRGIESSTVPGTARGLVEMKVSRLDDDQRETLEAAAVIGYEFEVGLLAAVLEQNRMKLLQRLAVLERRHRLLAGAGGAAFRFAGRPVYDALYAGMNPALREGYHGLVADTLLARVAAAGGAPDRPTADALLRHLLRSGRAREAEPFLEAALEHVAATVHASVAAPYLEEVAQAFSKAPPAKRLAVAMRLWGVYEVLASRPDQMRVLEHAAALADGLGEPAARGRVHALKAGSYWYFGDYERAAAEAELALTLAREAGDRHGEATSRHTLGVVALRRGDVAGCAPHLEEALRIRREIRDRRGEASTLQALGTLASRTGRLDEALATKQAALAIWREVGERRGEAALLMNVANELVALGRYEEGLSHLEEAIARHRETGATSNEAMALANLGHALSILGRAASARSAWERALRLFVDCGDANGEITVRTMLGTALAGPGEGAAARSHLEAAVALAERHGAREKLLAAHRSLGQVLHAAGERAEGWRHVERALALEDEVRMVGSRIETLSSLGSMALAEGDAPRALAWLEEALPPALAAGRGTAVLALCRVARARKAAGRPEEAVAAAREALDRIERAGGVAPVDAAEVYGALGDLLDDDAKREALKARAKAAEQGRAPDDVGGDTRRHVRRKPPPA